MGCSEATILALAAGCDGILMCASEPQAQLAALEAVVYAVEQGRLPLRRMEDALAGSVGPRSDFSAAAASGSSPASCAPSSGVTSIRR